MKNILEISLLFDFYRELLTEKQIEVFSLYYDDDFSLAEIAEQLNISRQAVHDILKRGEKLLYKYESKLKLVEKFLHQQKAIEEILNIINCAEESTSLDYIKEQFQKIKTISATVLENS